MKKTLTIKRDNAFMKVCMLTALELSSARFTPSAEVIVAASLRKPAPSYFITYERAMETLPRILNQKFSSRSRLTGRKKMWVEILDKLRAQNGITPQGTINSKVLCRILAGARPSSFFLSKSYALRLYRTISASSKPKKRNHHANLNLN